MGFADFYFKRQNNFEVKIQDKPRSDLNFIVVIPCYNEPSLIEMLESLKACQEIKSAIEVIVVINSSESEQQKVLDQNNKTLLKAKEWIQKNETPLLRFFILHEQGLPKKFAGAGLARKIGMDQAVARFNQIDNNSGVLLSLDADSNVKPNYFLEIEKHYKKYPKTKAATIAFAHNIDGAEFEDKIYDAISTYELYLRYYKHALAYSGFPYSFYTIGSCFTVKAEIYAKQGGMSKRQAGEDFYFLHKVFPLGDCYEINNTCVYPSSRVSDRVPFGTGPMVKTISESKEAFLTYNLNVFLEIKEFITQIGQLYRISNDHLSDILNKLPKTISNFLKQIEIQKAIDEINSNSSNQMNFINRFYRWFDAFQILKFLNFAHKKSYKKNDLPDESKKLYELITKKQFVEINTKQLLGLYRKLDN